MQLHTLIRRLFEGSKQIVDSAVPGDACIINLKKSSFESFGTVSWMQPKTALCDVGMIAEEDCSLNGSRARFGIWICHVMKPCIIEIEK